MYYQLITILELLESFRWPPDVHFVMLPKVMQTKLLQP